MHTRAQVEIATIGSAAVGAERVVGHALDTAANGHWHYPTGNGHRGEVHGLKTRAAEPVDRRRRYLIRPTGGEHRVARDIRALLADLRDAAYDDIADVTWRDAALLGEAIQRLGEKLLGVDLGQRAFAALPSPARGPHGIDDSRLHFESHTL
jgi:hypothetical protein